MRILDEDRKKEGGREEGKKNRKCNRVFWGQIKVKNEGRTERKKEREGMKEGKKVMNTILDEYQK